MVPRAYQKKLAGYAPVHLYTCPMLYISVYIHLCTCSKHVLYCIYLYILLYISIYLYIHLYMQDDTDMYPLYMAYTLYTGIYTIYTLSTGHTDLSLLHMAYTLYTGIYTLCIHDDTGMYPSVYGIYTIYRYIHHMYT